MAIPRDGPSSAHAPGAQVRPQANITPPANASQRGRTANALGLIIRKLLVSVKETPGDQALSQKSYAAFQMGRSRSKAKTMPILLYISFNWLQKTLWKNGYNSVRISDISIIFSVLHCRSTSRDRAPGKRGRQRADPHGRPPHGNNAICASPISSGSEHMRFMFCTACPAAPFTRLSMTERITTRPGRG